MAASAKSRQSPRELREACCEANRSLWRRGVVDLTFGNASEADRERGLIAIKPSGAPYDTLQADDIVTLRLDARPGTDGRLDLAAATVEGTSRPSSDTPTHLRLYQRFEGIGAIVHTHSRFATAFAQAGREIPCLGTTHADYFRGPVPISRAIEPPEIEGGYEWESANVIAEAVGDRDPMETGAVLMRGHAPFVWAETAAKAVERAFALEIVAEMAWRTLALDAEAPRLPEAQLEKHYWRKHGSGAYYGQPGR